MKEIITSNIKNKKNIENALKIFILVLDNQDKIRALVKLNNEAIHSYTQNEIQLIESFVDEEA